MANTVWLSPSATGEDYTNWTDPTNAFVSDDTRANPNGGSQDYYGFNPSLPSEAIIKGIEVRTEGGGTISPSPQCGIELSHDGGTTYTTTGYQNEHSGGTDSLDISGGSNDKWGRSWTLTEVNDTNFRVRLTEDVGTFEIDHIQVRFHYSIGTPFKGTTSVNGLTSIGF